MEVKGRRYEVGGSVGDVAKRNVGGGGGFEPADTRLTKQILA